MAAPQTGFDILNIGERVIRLDKLRYEIHQGAVGAVRAVIGTWNISNDSLIISIKVKSMATTGIGNGDLSTNFCEAEIETNESGVAFVPLMLRMAPNSVLYELVPEGKLIRVNSGKFVKSYGKRGSSALPYLVVTYIYVEDI
jgi:hypothetical protein